MYIFEHPWCWPICYTFKFGRIHLVHVMGFRTCQVPGYGSLGYGLGSAFSHPCLTHTQTLGLVGFLASLIACNSPSNVSHAFPYDPQMHLQMCAIDALKWAPQMCPSNAHTRHPQRPHACPSNVPLKLLFPSVQCQSFASEARAIVG